MCTFRDPTLARSKGLLAGINYIPGLLHLPDYLQLLHSWPREGEAPTAPPPPLPEGKQGATANATWSGRHFIQIPAVLVAHGIVCHKPSGLLTESSLRRREEKRRKKKNQKLLPAETNLQPLLRFQNSGRTFQESHSPSSIQALGKEDGTRSRQVPK